METKTLRTPSNMLVVALAFSDFVMIWSQAPPLFINVFMSKHWAFGPLACELYGFLGGVFERKRFELESNLIAGCGSLWMIIMIGYDRYNVIVKGFNGMKITPCIAFLMIVFSFAYSTALCILPLLKVWGSYKLEGLLLTCSFDYLTDDWINKSFTLFFFLGCFGLPMCFIIYFYSQIVYAVVAHERALKAQAKKMNVESLRSNTDANAESAEVRIAKVAITNICLWLLAWTPYAAIAMIGQFGGAHLLTPVVTQLPSFLAKTASCFNPIVYAVSHPKFQRKTTFIMATPQIFLDENYNLHYPPGAKHTDAASDDVLAVTHEHWTQFPPVHPFIQHFFGILFFVLWVISVSGNGLVIFIFLKIKTLRTPSNMLVVALAFSDFIMICSLAPPLFINVFIGKYWAFGPLGCELYGFLGGVFGCASLWMIIMIGYDRYNVIVKGFNGVKTTPCIAFLMIIFSFAYSTAVCLPPLLKDANAESAEVRIAKVAITNICLWLLAWTPYAAIAMIGQFGGAHLLTPVVTQLPSFLAKTASCFNPIVYAVSHPNLPDWTPSLATLNPNNAGWGGEFRSSFASASTRRAPQCIQ
eukprot:TCALIF_04003-PA protein Name:"Similar to Compound eye opsin BCRH2 (Hemigrapsus sanguineus)" AED:0.27 eAED:0.27 QI:0/0.4/0.18/0.81/1/1/11/0/584